MTFKSRSTRSRSSLCRSASCVDALTATDASTVDRLATDSNDERVKNAFKYAKKEAEEPTESGSKRRERERANALKGRTSN
jgi:uncharacterized protein YciW